MEVVEGGDRPSGVAIPEDVLDDFVVMRLAKLYAEGAAGSKIERAMQRHAGNGGCAALVAHGSALLGALDQNAFSDRGFVP